MLFAADVMSGPAEESKRRARVAVPVRADELVRNYWAELGESDVDEGAREFATRLVTGALANLAEIDERIRSRAEHWRISRMAVVDRNVLRLAVYEFLFEPTPRTVIINEALEVARRFSSFEATQFINGILDAVKRDLDRERPQADSDTEEGEEPPAAPAAPADESPGDAAAGEPEDDHEQSASVS
jgi:transcription antitermination protein NusB